MVIAMFTANASAGAGDEGCARNAACRTEAADAGNYGQRHDSDQTANPNPHHAGQARHAHPWCALQGTLTHNGYFNFRKKFGRLLFWNICYKLCFLLIEVSLWKSLTRVILKDDSLWVKTLNNMVTWQILSRGEDIYMTEVLFQRVKHLMIKLGSVE